MQSKKQRASVILSHVFLIFAISLIVAPILFAVIKATQTRAEVLSPSILPGGQLWNNIQQVWRTANLAVYIRNSLIIAAIVTLGKTIFSLLAGTAFVYFRFPLQGFWFGFILFTLMMPAEVLIVGLFELVAMNPPHSLISFLTLFNPFSPVQHGLGWSNSLLALTVPFLASATGTFLFRQHFLSLPRSLGEAARIDGAGPFRFLRHVLIPLSGNTIGALAMVQFVYVWDQYLWPRVVIRRDSMQVVQVGLNMLIGTGEGVEWGMVMAGAIISILPPLLIFLLLHEKFMKGFALQEEK